MEPDQIRELAKLVDGLWAFAHSITTAGVALDPKVVKRQYDSLYHQAESLIGDEQLRIYAPRYEPSHVHFAGVMPWPDDLPALTVSVGQLYRHARTVLRMEVERAKAKSAGAKPNCPIFIAHGRESAALTLTRDYIAALGLEPIVAENSASLGASVDSKVENYIKLCQAAVILATGDDQVTGSAVLQPRQNVIHEIGLAQQILENRVTYLLEENTQFPSNIAPKTYTTFTKDNLTKAFIAITLDFKAWQLL